MKFVVCRYKPDSYVLTEEPIRVFETEQEADDFVAPLQAAGQRGWRIKFGWEKDEEIQYRRNSDDD